MVTVNYVMEHLEGEPGPNFYWRGTPDDFLKLILKLHVLGQKNGETIILNDLAFVTVIGDCTIVLGSSIGGTTLCKVDENVITVDMDSSSWRSILGVFLRISFYPSHDYVEFDDLNITEYANFIVSSEG